MPSVSIIMPAYNARAYIRQAIQSVLDQTFTDWELLIIDDGSTDGTSDVVRRQFPSSGIHLFSQKNQGPASARNLGLHNAHGALLAFLDVDDRWRPEKLAVQVPLFDNLKIGVVYGNAIFTGGLIEGQDNFFAVNRPVSGNVTTPLLRRNFIPMLTAVIRADLLQTLGGFNPNLRAAEDYDLWLRAARHTAFDYTPDILAEYAIHTSSTTSNSELMWKSELDVLWAYWKEYRSKLNSFDTQILAERIAILAEKISLTNKTLARQAWADVRWSARIRSLPRRWLKFAR